MDANPLIASSKPDPVSTTSFDKSFNPLANFLIPSATRFAITILVLEKLSFICCVFSATSFSFSANFFVSSPASSVVFPYLTNSEFVLVSSASDSAIFLFVLSICCAKFFSEFSDLSTTFCCSSNAPL